METKVLEEYDIYVDFGKGDKFKVDVSEIDENKKKIILKGSQGQLGWVRIEERYGQRQS